MGHIEPWDSLQLEGPHENSLRSLLENYLGSSWSRLQLVRRLYQDSEKLLIL